MRPRRIQEETFAELLRRRDLALGELARGRRHLLSYLRNPDPIVEGIPVGDLLCHAPGLDEGDVSHLLHVSKVRWGRRTGLLSDRDVRVIGLRLKELHGDLWDDWQKSSRRRPTKGAAA